jgi:hypothetical protein
VKSKAHLNLDGLLGCNKTVTKTTLCFIESEVYNILNNLSRRTNNIREENSRGEISCLMDILSS